MLKIVMRFFRHHNRLFVSIILGFIVFLLAPNFGITSKVTQAIVGYDIASLSFIIWAFLLMYNATSQEMHKKALTQDEGKFIVLMLVVIAVLFSIFVIFADLANIKNLSGTIKFQKLMLSLTTIVLAWFFTNFIFALNYAHDYFFEIQKGRKGGLIFLPEDEEPKYFDFLYFSFVIGATAQTADVTISSKKMRHTVLIQSIIAFFFNATLLALTVNIASGLI